MNAALLRLSVRHPDCPGVRLWLCADGTEVAAFPGGQSFTGRCVVVYARADWDKGSFFGYPTRPGGDERMRTVAREFIAHNGCAPRSAEEEDDEDQSLDPSDIDPEEAELLKLIEEAKAVAEPVEEQDHDDDGQSADLAELAPGERVIAANRQLIAMKAAWAEMDHVNPLAEACWVRIMCDYCADPVWARGGGNCDLESLPVSPGLIDRLRAWARLYKGKSSSTGVLNWRHRRQFSEEGLAIAEAVKAELPDWTVVYHDEEMCEETVWTDGTPRSVFEYEICCDYRVTRAARFAAIAREASLVAGETLLREGEVVGTFQEILNVQHGRVWVSVRTAEPVVQNGRTYGHSRHFYGDWRKA